MGFTFLIITALLVGVSRADDYRLPTYYSPSNYTVNINLPSAIFTTENATAFSGTVSITFTSTENVSEVVLHASATYLNVTAVTLTSGINAYNVTGYFVNSTTDILNITLENSLLLNQTYVLDLTFDGNLSTTDMYGLYKSSYNDSSNVTHYIATTQMEATYARRAFPCFDEPSFKANFSLILTYPSGFKVQANTDVLSNTTSENNSTIITTFKQTPAMSTYLVAFIVSNFTCSSGNLIEGTLVNEVCSRNETSSTRSWALEVAPLAIDSLNTYLGINYSENMEKLDQVAIPDFSAGAMENWGLITYRERALLYDANETSNAIKQYIASVISHELAHQWFGNLVTCKWWSAIFLNEGFATFFEYFTTNEIYPEFEMDKQFVIKVLHYIFEIDASSTEALVAEASTPSQIATRFGITSYDKGGSVFRMVEHILGSTLWKTQLNAYLKQYAYSSVEPDHLWTVLNTNVSLPAENLSVVMANWTNYPGFPLVTVTLNNSQLTISQERFVYSNKTAKNITWYVPVTFTTSQNTLTFNETAPVVWLTPSNGSVTTTLSGNISWIIVNNLQTGYFRVNYDSNLWASLTTALRQTNFSGIPEMSRAQIVDDAFNLARGGYLTYSQVFNITQFLANETSYYVWYAAYSGFGYLLRRVGENSTLGNAVMNQVLTLSSSLISSVPITVTNESDHIYTLNQVQAQSWACRLGDTNCTTAALQLFASYRNTSVRPDKNLRSIVYANGLKHSTDISVDWEFMWSAFLSTSLSTEQVTILSALGSTTNETILNLYLQKTLDDNSGIRSQDYVSVFAAVYGGSSVGVDVALDFFISNYNLIIARDTSMNGVSNILRGIAERITTSEQIIKLQRFISSNVLNGTVLQAANTALTTAQENYEWVNTYRSDLYSFYGLEEETSGTSTASTRKSFLAISLMMLGLIVLKL